MSEIINKYSNKIPTGTIIGIVASMGFHGVLFAFPNLPLFSVEKKEIKSMPVPIVALNEAEIARLPDLSPQPTQIPEFPNTPLSETPLLETAVKLPFLTNIPTPPPPLPDSSVVLPPPEVAEKEIREEIESIPQIKKLPQELPIAKIIPPAPPIVPKIEKETTQNEQSFINEGNKLKEEKNERPIIPQRDDLGEVTRKLEGQQEIEKELKIEIDEIPIRSTEDILREFSAPQITINGENENNNKKPEDQEEKREFPLLPPSGRQEIVLTPEEINIINNRRENNTVSEEELIRRAQENAKIELQQRVEALEVDKSNTSDQEANNNYLNWLVSINNIEPEKLTIKGKYPKDACLKKLEGSTTYGVLVNKEGVATNLQLIKSSGYPIFNNNARYDIDFHNFPKNAAKPYLITVDFKYNENLCPEQLAPNNSQKPTSNNTPPIVNTNPSSFNNTFEEKKPLNLDTENNSVSEEKKPVNLENNLETENNSVSEEKKPLNLDTENNSVSEEKKPVNLENNLDTENNSVSEEKKPLNLDTENNSVSEGKKTS